MRRLGRLVWPAQSSRFGRSWLSEPWEAENEVGLMMGPGRRPCFLVSWPFRIKIPVQRACIADGSLLEHGWPVQIEEEARRARVKGGRRQD